ncbi:hypothetical protein SIAM614_12158 [Stappia aggregata IAM 12614]|uniref:Uncharacterized protein n=1 Tax=Roseibium aggregatum (strain ATCC 25650 / DSM 13394 / JCM 20685 / NBRC 16684 / NCIMB 2208 / IAM 12614 / B1) TaxID=384765 RepID=A0NTW9_ROSAI|nr:DUF302 domain-containing protein [Roseibium aggregatum]EAV43878.1 hypothetical protein SIAM614_12158 [Stappia aggregata IAM 12614] [Roseibium aggregatum IAM 12614]
MFDNFRKPLQIAIAFAGIAACGTLEVSAQTMPEGVTAYQVSAAFDDVRFDLENAIVNHGLVIDYVSHIGDMLDRTSEDVGGKKQIFVNAQTMLFCSANLSRKVMEADAANIAYCPYSVFVFETPDQPGSVTVGYRHLDETGSEASKAAIGEVNALLDAIAKEATGQ